MAARAESTEETAEATLLMASEAREDAIEKLDKALKLGRHAQRALAAALAKDRTTEQCVEDAHQIVKALHAKINLEQERIVQNKKPRDSRHR